MKILAHRGAHDPEHPGVRENTVEAFEIAAGLGIDGVEFDVRRSADGHLVVHHDAVLPDGRVIADTVRADLPPWVPGLEAVLDVCAGMTLIDVEVKNWPHEAGYDSGDDLACAVAEVTGPRSLLGSGHDLLVSSFNMATLDAFRRADPVTQTGWLTLPAYDQGHAACEASTKGHSALHLPTGVAIAETVDLAHDLGLEVAVWVVDQPEQMELMARLGVDVIVTYCPALAATVLGRTG
ncbi:MAG: glycerophosphodiester phosphodiesterase [Acidimicrobiales bacterium]